MESLSQKHSKPQSNNSWTPLSSERSSYLSKQPFRLEMNFLGDAINVLSWIGIFSWGGPSKWTLWTLNVYRVAIFVLIGVLTALMFVQMFVATDLAILTRTIDIWTMFLSGLYKWFCMTAFNEEFMKLSTDLDNIQAQGSTARGRSADTFTADYLKFTRQITYWYMISGGVSSLLIIASPLLTYPRGDRSALVYYNDPKSYPLSCWLPFVMSEDWMFSTNYIVHAIALLIVVSMYLGIDSFFFGSIHAIGGQIELLNSNLNDIKPSLENTGDPSTQISRYTAEQQMKCYSMLRECAKHHILILNYIKKVCTLFSSLIILDYLHGLTSVTFALFQMTISDGISEKISVVCFIVLSVYHQYLNNFFGEFILQKQLSVCATLYGSPWWRADKKIRQLLTLMILRSIKPTIISGFYMYKLSYESFIAFVKALYTYYMVLRRVNGEDKTL